MKFGLDAQKFLLFVFLDGGDRNTGPAGNHLFDVFAGDNTSCGIVKLVAVAQAAQSFFFLALFFGVKAGLFEFVRGNRAFHAMSDELHTFLYFADLIRHSSLAQFHARASFID